MFWKSVRVEVWCPYPRTASPGMTLTLAWPLLKGPPMGCLPVVWVGGRGGAGVISRACS